ncbi:MAG: WYL domain-containing protein [Sulfurovaceae bacterium]|nr:WYL domain-containing protein [Sulfurovaceae bacterium]
MNFIEKIQKSKIAPTHFNQDYTEKIKAEEFLKNIQSPYSDMVKQPYSVKLQVSYRVARYFKSKKYLKSQKLLKTLENEDILVSYEIYHELEIIPIIQRWIPHIQVIEPLELKEKIVKNIEEFMKGL